MVTCDECKGDCCRKIAIHIDTPRSKSDFEDLKWFLYHEGLKVYKDNLNDWLVLLNIKCKHLKGGKCVIYENRPPICREAEVGDCERNVEETKILFSKPEDVDAFIKKRFGRSKAFLKR